jgi:glucose/arabinose dehydrogenase
VNESSLNGPKHLCIDPHSNVIVADAENHLIRRYNAKSGRLATLDIEGLNRPHGVVVHKDGSLYIADSYNNRILRVTND